MKNLNEKQDYDDFNIEKKSFLSEINVIASFCSKELLDFEKYLEILIYEPNSIITCEENKERNIYFILEGEVRIYYEKNDLGILPSGYHFGDLGFITEDVETSTVVALDNMKVAKLSWESYKEMLNDEPQLAIKFIGSLIGSFGGEILKEHNNVNFLLQQRHLPRRTLVDIKIDGVEKKVRIGTPLKELFTEKIDNEYVVSALVNNKTVSLLTPVTSTASITSLTTSNWEGERIYRISAALLLLEAASSVAPEITFKMGTSLGNNQWIKIEPLENVNLKELAEKLTIKMNELIEQDVHFREELWSVEEAIDYFLGNNWFNSAQLLKTWRESTVKVVSCGEVYVLSMTSLVASAGVLKNFELYPNTIGLILKTGKRAKIVYEKAEIIYPYAEIMHKHEKWLNSLGITSVGKLNEASINGKISEIIRVAEGFHEKQISRIADIIAEQEKKVKIICIAGPSSSGKTTFIKRLTVQLQVNGLSPIAISLDDYYLELNEMKKDENGDYDFEALDALNLRLLGEQFLDILDGKPVRIAHFDFLNNKSFPNGGKEINFGENNILLLEGIHGLNPNLLGKDFDKYKIFKIFIQPMTSLSFDKLLRVNPSDVRLLRRIVRDRHQRGYSTQANIMRWPSVRKGEQTHIFPFIKLADVIFDTSLIYEISVLKVYAERYLLEVPQDDPAYITAYRLRQLIDKFVAIYPDHVPPTSILREFIGGSVFEY